MTLLSLVSQQRRDISHLPGELRATQQIKLRTEGLNKDQLPLKCISLDSTKKKTLISAAGNKPSIQARAALICWAGQALGSVRMSDA